MVSEAQQERHVTDLSPSPSLTPEARQALIQRLQAIAKLNLGRCGECRGVDPCNRCKANWLVAGLLNEAADALSAALAAPPTWQERDRIAASVRTALFKHTTFGAMAINLAANAVAADLCPPASPVSR